MGEDEWVKAAMMDDSVVAELLMGLHQLAQPAKILVVPLEWGTRQPRSRQVLRCNIVQVKKEGESTRASPTTPLSWSGGTSVSGGAGGGGGGLGGAGGSGGGDFYEECSGPVKRPTSVRSKVAGTSETPNRRTRKKKTFAELKEEECLLLKESIYLKKEVAKLRAVCEEERARNSTLKRMKLDLQLQSAKQTGASDVLKERTCEQLCDSDIDQTTTVLSTSDTCCEPDTATCPESHLSDTSEVPSEAVAQKSPMVLPDLNLPLDDSTPEDLYGMS